MNINHGWKRRPICHPEESRACGPPKVMKNTLGPATALQGSVALRFVIPSNSTCLRQVEGEMTRQESPWMQGPEGRPPNVSPARKGWEINPEEDERRRCGTVSLGAKLRDLLFSPPTNGC
jgi:hypothetical protein